MIIAGNLVSNTFSATLTDEDDSSGRLIGRVERTSRVGASGSIFKVDSVGANTGVADPDPPLRWFLHASTLPELEKSESPLGSLNLGLLSSAEGRYDGSG